ncbi:MAG: 2-C-methyl-D-erythritol 4-phosphate cytidylyltransferase [Parasporobacterium sp.]|nr:2-C-methyl-D-erythritol 4-phosphate cytidylyltransferase [Parasporobacterium sp.]
MKTAAIVLSGGKGLRFGSDIPKQYMEIGGKSILAYAVNAFEKSDVDEIVIVAAQEHIGRCRKIVLDSGFKKVTDVIPGGAQRYDSVLMGLRHLMSEEREIPEIVLIHDGARPFIRPETVNEIIRCVMAHGAAIAAVPCTDTIKIADENGCIVSTTDRTRTWAAQTPQAFRMEEICRAYEEVIGNAHPENLTGITDDAMVYQMAYPECSVRLVNAGTQNFKITAADDMIRAESMLFADSGK